MKEGRPDGSGEDVEKDEDPERVSELGEVGESNSPTLEDLLGGDLVWVEGGGGGIGGEGSMVAVVNDAVEDVGGEAHAGGKERRRQKARTTRQRFSPVRDERTVGDKMEEVLCEAGKINSRGEERASDERTSSTEPLGERIRRDRGNEAGAFPNDESEGKGEP